MSYKKKLLIVAVVISPGILDRFLNCRVHQRWHITKNCIEILSAVLWSSQNDNEIQSSVIIYTIHNYLRNRKYTPLGTFDSEDAYKNMQRGWKF